MRYLAFAASHRDRSYNRILARFVAEKLTAHGGEVDFPEYGELELPLFNDARREAGDIPPAAARLAERFAAAQGFVIAMPEYNWSIPGSLKNTLDWLSHFRPAPFERKTALLLSASPGRRGGVLGLTHLKTVMEALGVYVLPSCLTLGEAHLHFEGDIISHGETVERLSQLTSYYIDFAERLSR